MIMECHKSGINPHTYATRCELMLKHFPDKAMKVPEINGVSQLDCNMNIDAVCIETLVNYVSYQEVSRCKIEKNKLLRFKH